MQRCSNEPQRLLPNCKIAGTAGASSARDVTIGGAEDRSAAPGRRMPMLAHAGAGLAPKAAGHAPARPPWWSTTWRKRAQAPLTSSTRSRLRARRRGRREHQLDRRRADSAHGHFGFQRPGHQQRGASPATGSCSTRATMGRRHAECIC